jgi:hypothetical protein
MSSTNVFQTNVLAPWGDIPRVAGLLGPAKENGFCINTHKVGTVVISRGGVVCFITRGIAHTHA